MEAERSSPRWAHFCNPSHLWRCWFGIQPVQAGWAADGAFLLAGSGRLHSELVRQRDEWPEVWKGGKRKAGRGGAGRRGDWLIALFGGWGLSQQQQLLEGPLLKCFSSSLPPVISPISCFHQLIASQGPWHVTNSPLFAAISLPSSRARPCSSKLSLSGHWCPTCSYISWVHLLGGCWLSLAICAVTIRLKEELGLLLPCTGPMALSSVVTLSYPMTWHCKSIDLGPCCVLLSWGSKRGLLSLGTPEGMNLSLLSPNMPRLYQDCHWLYC